MRNKLPLLLTAFFLVIASVSNAQTAMADTMRSNGKIFVVVGVLVIIFSILFTFVILMDRKLKKLEKSISEK